MNKQQQQQKEQQDGSKKSGIDKYFSISDHLRRMGVIDTCSDPQCRHDEGCLYNLVNATIRGFALGYAAKSSLALVSVLMNFSKLLKQPSLLVKALLNKQVLRFAMFPAVYNLILHGSQCGLRKSSISVSPGIKSFISGFVAAYISLATREPKNRSLWGVFLLSRAFDCFYRSLCNRGVITHHSFNYTLMFCMLYILLARMYAVEPLNLPPVFNKLQIFFTAEQPEEFAFRRCWIEKQNNVLEAKGIPRMNVNKAFMIGERPKRN